MEGPLGWPPGRERLPEGAPSTAGAPEGLEGWPEGAPEGRPGGSEGAPIGGPGAPGLAPPDDEGWPGGGRGGPD